MEILFKDDECLYYIEEGLILFKMITPHCGDLSEIKHLGDVKPIYHYRDNKDGELYPVYYEHNGRFLSEVDNAYYIELLTSSLIKDYTLTNLNLI